MKLHPTQRLLVAAAAVAGYAGAVVFHVLTAGAGDPAPDLLASLATAFG
jgi:hypothetical protein